MLQLTLHIINSPMKSEHPQITISNKRIFLINFITTDSLKTFSRMSFMLAPAKYETGHFK